MTSKEIISELEKMGSPSIKKTLLNHGAKEPFFGVKISDLKPLQKKIKKDYKLSMELYDSGISDARYLAGLIADESKMTKADIQHWADGANWPMLTESTVPWVASESAFGYELGKEWIDATSENIASAGWCTLSCLVALKPDDELNIPEILKLMKRVEKEIHKAPNRVRYTMNGFILSVGAYVKELTQTAINTANRIGEVTVHMGDTACKVPDVVSYLSKMEQAGKIGKKKKTVKC